MCLKENPGAQCPGVDTRSEIGRLLWRRDETKRVKNAKTIKIKRTGEKGNHLVNQLLVFGFFIPNLEYLEIGVRFPFRTRYQESSERDQRELQDLESPPKLR